VDDFAVTQELFDSIETLLSRPVKESAAFRPVNRKKVYPRGDRIRWRFKDVKFEPVPLNCRRVEIPVKHRWPP